MRGKKLGFWEVVAIGIGGMIGGGIFAVLGLTVLLARGAAPLAFIVAGLLALVTAYSYAKLTVRYPSEGGTIEFLVQAFGPGIFASWLNTLLLASYIIMLSLYAYAFGSYGAVLVSGVESPFLKKVLTGGVILLFTLLNLLGAYIVGRAEDLMVAFKVLILLLFSALGFLTLKPEHLSLAHYPPPLHILTGGLIIFLAYEGFELIANTAQDVRHPDRTLPRAFYFAVLFVIAIYVLVAVVAVGNLDYAEVVKAKDYVLAEAARPFLGETGFVIIGLAALISTASAINATLYGTARISYLVAKYGELPRVFGKRIWHGAYEGLIILAGLTLIMALSFDLENISVAGSLGFLLVFGAVNLAHLKLLSRTGGSRLLPLLGTVGCLVSALILIGHNLRTHPESLKSAALLLGATLIFEVLYRTLTPRRLSRFIDWKLREKEEFLDRFEEYLQKIVAAIETHIKESEIYLLDELARGERAKAHKLHLAIVTPQKLSPQEEEAHRKHIRRRAGIHPHHPLELSFLSQEEKERLRRRPAIELRRQKGLK